VIDKQLWEHDLDAFVLRELSCLRSFRPTRSFADRVMAQVRRPRPVPVVLLHRAGAWALQPRRAVALTVAYATCVAVALRLALPWIAAHGSLFSLAGSWVTTRAHALFDAAALEVATVAVQLGAADLLRSATGGHLYLAGVALAIGYAVSGFGLHLLLKAPRRDDVRVSGAR
jgi:hypothetical protein